MGTDPALPQAQACSATDPEPENSFRFTPIKALQALPRLWERKPSTPFRAGLKSRKLWKRFRSSFTSMTSLQSSTVLENDALQTAISTSKDSGYVRGVKRLCVGPGESENCADVEVPQPGRSFLETKWESAAVGKRRKLPDAPIDIFDESLQNGLAGPTANGKSNSLDYTEKDLAMTGSPRPLSTLQSPSRRAIFNDETQVENQGSPVSDAKAAENLQSRPADHEQCAAIDSAAKDATKVRDLTQEQEGTLVRSALRSSLDGEDAELLNDFLSKAQAKRAAKAALLNSQGDVVENSPSPDESPQTETECSTPRARRALEALDTNSPSPAKVQISPSKVDVTPGDEAQENETSKDIIDEEPAPASPACRRSTRVKAPSANAPPVRNTIALRRAKGNEFVFLQRTESQQLALATKRNTRNNRGNSLMPRAALEAMAQQQDEEPATADNDPQARTDRRTVRSRRPEVSLKHVSWNEERLAEYEDERETSEELEEEGAASQNDVGGTSGPRPGTKRLEKSAASSTRSGRRQVQQQAGPDADSAQLEAGPSTSTTAASSSSATPRSRRVRRLGDSTMISGTPVKTGSGRISKPPVAPPPAMAVAGPSTPTKARRKLVPKSPSSSLLTGPASKSTDQPFVSGIPTRSASTSEGTKRKAVLQSSAGCTPMPRRVRART
ncbi:uncharacterized protein N7459_009545 [Penicillium hispanicum]|uniref:uncharacterized protein n=1 Tax=Penicillium hispanicum TaxID=1080232 RepID=UPI0025409659|nr:uncharacterized protein N7459_009545 [Penicillium hispanicum]KAJ5570115.1 hypothetical protein N7459_009545 [Penicillium hispanicum]